MVRRVMGIEKGVTKKETPFTILHLVGDHSDYSKEHNNAQGVLCENRYVSKDVQCKLEDTVELVLEEGFGGKAYIADVKVLSSGK